MKDISIQIKHETAEQFLECLGLVAAVLETDGVVGSLEVDHVITVNPANLPEGCEIIVFRTE